MFKYILQDAFDLIPSRNVTLSHKDKPWMTPRLKLKINDMQQHGEIQSSKTQN